MPYELQVEELQQQLATMQTHHQHQRQQRSMPDPSYEAVIAGLRSSMAQVSSMVSTVSQENKLLNAENQRLQELREQQSHALQQKQVGPQRISQAQGNLCVIRCDTYTLDICFCSCYSALLCAELREQNVLTTCFDLN